MMMPEALQMPLRVVLPQWERNADAQVRRRPYAAVRLVAPAAAQQPRTSVQSPPDEQFWQEAMAAIALRQDRAAFAALFGHFAPRVKAFLMKGGASAPQAEECAQDVMATLWQKAALYDPARASVATWIFTIARNRRIDMIRRARRPEPEQLTWGPEAEPDQDAALALRQDCEKLGQALAQLPPKQRELVEKAYWGELTQSEIAAQTGLPLGTIKSRLRLALDRLRHEMK
jgi:RNA polymerase sigma factor (sigma-70 family)